MEEIWNYLVSMCIKKERSQNAFNSVKKNSMRITSYLNSFISSEENEKRNNERKEITKSYYDIATDFYEMGWGESFHFAPRFKGESLNESLRRHEYQLGYKGMFCQGDKILDAGCGIMGPARNICRFTGANITGLNLNEYQVSRSKTLNGQTPFKNRLSCVNGDFTATNFQNGEFDHVYSIEAFCHVPDRVAIFNEMYRILKPGGNLVFYDWVLTAKFDHNNKNHLELKHKIEKGNGIANLITIDQVKNSLKIANFKIMEFKDLSDAHNIELEGNNVSWYKPFEPSFTITHFPNSPMGRYLINKTLNLAQMAKLVPSGTSELHTALTEGADALLESGRLRIFTPMLFVLARKPYEENK